MVDKRFEIGALVRIKEDSTAFIEDDAHRELVGKVHHHYLVHGEYAAYVEFSEDDARYIAENELELANE